MRAFHKGKVTIKAEHIILRHKTRQTEALESEAKFGPALYINRSLAARIEITV